jgi:hypothetical protein
MRQKGDHRQLPSKAAGGATAVFFLHPVVRAANDRLTAGRTDTLLEGIAFVLF